MRSLPSGILGKAPDYIKYLQISVFVKWLISVFVLAPLFRDELKKIDEQQTGGVKEGGRKESREERQIRALKVGRVVFST